MVTRELALSAVDSAVDFALQSVGSFHCPLCHSALGTRRPDSSVALYFRGATVIVREGAVVCGVCGHSQLVFASPFDTVRVLAFDSATAPPPD